MLEAGSSSSTLSMAFRATRASKAGVLCMSGRRCHEMSNIIRSIPVIPWTFEKVPANGIRAALEGLFPPFSDSFPTARPITGKTNDSKAGKRIDRGIVGHSFNKFSTADHRNHYFRPSCFGTHDQRACFRLIAEGGAGTLTGSDPYTWRLHRAMNRTRA